MDLFRKPLDLLKAAEKFIKDEMDGYDTAQQKKANEERIRLQKLADAEVAKQKKILDEKIARAEASGKTEKVEELKEQKENVVPIIAPVIAPQVNKPAGISYRDKWTPEIINVNLVPREYLVPNMQAIEKIGQATKGSIPIPGVKFNYSRTVVSK